MRKDKLFKGRCKLNRKNRLIYNEKSSLSVCNRSNSLKYLSIGKKVNWYNLLSKKEFFLGNDKRQGSGLSKDQIGWLLYLKNLSFIGVFADKKLKIDRNKLIRYENFLNVKYRKN